MGQAFDRDGNVLGEAYGDSKREVFDKLTSEFKNAHEIRIRSAETSAEAPDDPVRAFLARERFEREHGGTSTPMPQYQCHKKVWALKIKDLLDPTVDGNESDGSFILVPAEEGYAPFRVSRSYVQKHNPERGGYFVQYEDGYTSFSPALAFETGYTLAGQHRLSDFGGKAPYDPPRAAPERLSLENIEQAFHYQEWSPDQVRRGHAVTEMLIAAAKVILLNVPECPTRTRALNCLVDSRMLANSAITHDGRF